MTTALDHLADDAIAQNPTSVPSLNTVQARAAQRSRSRRILASSAAITVAAAIGAASWSALSVDSSSEVVVAVDDSTEEATGSPLPLPASLIAYLDDHAAPLPTLARADAIDAQQPPLDLDNVAVFELPELNLSLAVASTIDRSQVCALEINASVTGVTCTDVDTFERNGITVYIQDATAAVFGTYALLPAGMDIGFVDKGTVHPSGFVVTWRNWDHQQSLRIVDGAIELDLDGNSRPATTVVEETLDPLLGAEGMVWFDESCAVLIHVYNAAGRGGIATQVVETLAAAIEDDPDLTGQPAALNAPTFRSEAVTILIEETAACADLDRLNEAIPPADIVQRNVSPTDLDALRFDDVGPGRIAIILGLQYQP